MFKVRLVIEFMKSKESSVSARVLDAVCNLLDKFLDTKKLSQSAREAAEQAKTAADEVVSADGDCLNKTEEVALSAEMMEELKDNVKKVLIEQAEPVYADCVIFFCEKPLDADKQELLEDIVTNINEDNNLWEDEHDVEYQAFVDKFMENHLGSNVIMNDDCYIDRDYISLNFYAEDYLDAVYHEEDIRALANALNYFLGDKYITGFQVF